MTDFPILPADPRDMSRDRYRALSCEARPGNPQEIPFTAPRATPAWVGWAKSLALLALLSGLFWTGLVVS